MSLPSRRCSISLPCSKFSVAPSVRYPAKSGRPSERDRPASSNKHRARSRNLLASLGRSTFADHYVF
jgi:hypothetical protein